MDMKIWLHCNTGCGQFCRTNPTCRFAFTNCGHVICESCAKKVAQNSCPVCKKTTKMMMLSDQIPQDIKSLFMDPTHIVTQQQQQRQQQQQQLLQQYQQLQQQDSQLLQQYQQLQQQDSQLQQQYSKLLQQQEALCKQQQQQYQRVSQIQSFQKQQYKSLVASMDKTKQHETRKLKAELEAEKTEFKNLKMKLNTLNGRNQSNSRQTGATTVQHSNGGFQTMDDHLDSTYKSPSSRNLFNTHLQQNSVFPQNNGFGGKASMVQTNNDQIRRQNNQKGGQLCSAFGQIGATGNTTPSVVRNAGQLNGVNLGSMHQNQEVVGATAVRFKSPAPPQPPRAYIGAGNNGRISLVHHQSSLRSPASVVGSSIGGVAGMSPATSVESLNYFNLGRKHF